MPSLNTIAIRGELTARIDVERSDEWGQVEKMLNKMADDLLASHHALQQSEEKYREIFNTPDDSIFLHDADSGAIVDVNQAVLDMYGYPYEEVLHQDLGTLSLGEHPYTMEEAIKKVNRAKQEGPQLFEWRAKRKDGKLFWAEVGLKASRFSGRDYVIAIVRLLSDARKAIERATKLTGQLLTFAKGGDPVKETTNLAQLIREAGDFVLHGSHISCTYSCSDDLRPRSRWMSAR